MVDAEHTSAQASSSSSAPRPTLDRWLRLHVPEDRDRNRNREDEDRPLADISEDLDRAGDDKSVTGVELTIDSIESVEEMNALLDEFDDRDVRIENLVVELR
ncbi:hypothetical protein BRC68_15135 [Halobacteriales archaeon QH_6_64_20]|jgi:hypothetical protein|nr:MAG: hypothetical protein BRC68_15135 [Halobacteriales archaeon QH_6_64_20]